MHAYGRVRGRLAVVCMPIARGLLDPPGILASPNTKSPLATIARDAWPPTPRMHASFARAGEMARVSTALKLAAGIRHVLDSPFSCASSCVSHTAAVISLIRFKPARTQTLELQHTTTLRMPGCI